MDNSKKRVIIYCRESRDDYGTNYERIETQRDLLVKFCNDNGYTNIIDIIMHNNWSGTDFSRFDEIKERVLKKEFNVLVLKDSSRLGRNLLESLKFIEFLEENNIEVLFEGRSYDLELFPLESWFNERRAKDDSQKIRKNLHHKMTEGKLIIREHFGYKKIDKKLIIDEEAAQIVRKIFNLYLEGYGYRAIANILQNENIPTPSQYKSHGKYPVAKVWRGLHVQRILTNQVYVGDMVSGTTEKVSFKSKKTRRVSKEKWIIVKNTHEPIIDRKMFDKVQDLIDSKIEFAPKTPKPSPFSGKLICGKCRTSLYIIRSKRIPHAFVCGKYYNEGAIKDNLGLGCTSHRVREIELFNIVKKHLVKLFEDESYKKELEESSLKHESSQRHIEELISKTESEVQLMQNQYKQVYDDKLNNIIPEFLFVDKTKELQEKMERLNIKLQNLLNELTKIEKGIEDNNKFEVVVNRIMLNGLTKETVDEIIDKIIVFDEHEIQEEDKTVFNISDERYTKIYENGGIIIVYKGMYQHVLTNRWIRKHIDTWRERAGMG